MVVIGKVGVETANKPRCTLEMQSTVEDAKLAGDEAVEVESTMTGRLSGHARRNDCLAVSLQYNSTEAVALALQLSVGQGLSLVIHIRANPLRSA